VQTQFIKDYEHSFTTRTKCDIFLDGKRTSMDDGELLMTTCQSWMPRNNARIRFLLHTLPAANINKTRSCTKPNQWYERWKEFVANVVIVKQLKRKSCSKRRVVV